MTRRSPRLLPALLATVLALSGAGSVGADALGSSPPVAASSAPTRNDENARKVCANYERRGRNDAEAALASHFAGFARGCAQAIAVIWTPSPSATAEGLEAARAVLFAMVDHQMAVNALSARHAARHGGNAAAADATHRAKVPGVTRTGDYLIAIETGVPQSIALLRHRLGQQTTALGPDGGGILR